MNKKAINQQRGSIILPFVVSLLVGLILLGGVQVGYYFFMKRELQNTADLAVLSGVQMLSEGCAAAENTGRANALKNFESHGKLSLPGDEGVAEGKEELKVECGIWDANVSNERDNYYFKPKDPNDLKNPSINALRVQITKEVLPMMPYSSAAIISVEAIAKKELLPKAAFSVGPSLLRLQEGLLTGLLEDVGLGVIGTQILSHEGLANVRITPAGLLEALGVPVDVNADVATLNGTLNGKVVLLEELVVASLKAVGGEEVLGVNIEALDKILKTNIEIEKLTTNIQIPLGTMGNSRGLFAEIMAPAQSALNAKVGLSDILNVVASVATKHNAVNVGIDEPIINLGGLLRVEAKATVIEPPSIGIGGPDTTAYSSNIRVFARVCLDTGGTCQGIEAQSGGSTSLLGGLLGSLIKLKVDLPLVIELVNGKGTLGQMCHATDAQGRNAADITVETHVGDICVGAFDLQATQGTLKHPFSGVMSCVNKLKSSPNDFKHKILDLSLNLSSLKVPLASLDTSLAIPALTTEETKTFFFHDPKTEPENIANNTKWMPESGNDLSVGTTVKGLVDAILASLIGSSTNNDLKANQIGPKVAEELWYAAKKEVGCDPGHWLNGPNCRGRIMEKAKDNIEQSLNGLSGFLGGLSNNTLGLVGNVLTLNVSGIVQSLGNVVESVVKLVTNLLGGLLGGDGCVSSGLLGTANEAGCIKLLKENSSISGETEGQPNALLVVLGLLTNLLQGPLDALGGQLLSPLLNALGLKVGQVETTLISLDCKSGAQLVY